MIGGILAAVGMLVFALMWSQNVRIRAAPLILTAIGLRYLLRRR